MKIEKRYTAQVYGFLGQFGKRTRLKAIPPCARGCVCSLEIDNQPILGHFVLLSAGFKDWAGNRKYSRFWVRFLCWYRIWDKHLPVRIIGSLDRYCMM